MKKRERTVGQELLDDFCEPWYKKYKQEEPEGSTKRKREEEGLDEPEDAVQQFKRRRRTAVRDFLRPARRKIVEEVEEDRPLNAVIQGINYHPVAVEVAFIPACKQRSKKWFMIRMVPVTASRLGTIMGINKYLEHGEEPPPGVSKGEWNKLKLYLEQTMQIPRGTMQNTGDLLIDHIRRGVVGEELVTRLFELATGFTILEVSSMQNKNLGFVWVSPDGLIAETGETLEIKMPAILKDYYCKKTFTRRIWKCRGYLEGKECEGYHLEDTCEYEDVQQECNDYWRCPKCSEDCMTIYPHQVKAQMDTVDAPGAYFVQLKSYAAITEILGIRDCKDGLSPIDFERAVWEFCAMPTCDIVLPEGKKAEDYLMMIHVERDYRWPYENGPTLWQYHCKVMEYREKHNITFEKYAAYHGMKFE